MMCVLNIDEEFDEIPGNILNDVLLGNLMGGAASSAVGFPVNNRQVLATLAVIQEAME